MPSEKNYAAAFLSTKHALIPPFDATRLRGERTNCVLTNAALAHEASRRQRATSTRLRPLALAL